METSADCNFFDKVYAIVRRIPEGRVTTYGAIARFIGAPQSAIMIGWAMNASHNLPDIPAHRVVNRAGRLTGKHHFDGINLMEQLLMNEGITIEENTVVDFKNRFWNPADHLSPFT